MTEHSNNLCDLPKGWVWTTLKDVCLHPQYGWTTSAVQQGRLRLLRTTDITSGKIKWECVPFCEKEPDDKGKYLLDDGDIVISRAGSVGFSLLIRNPKESVFASYLIRFKPLIDKDYEAYFLKTPVYWGAISEKKLGIALANVNATKLKEIAVPLAPLKEQKRIVAKIEELFTRLDAGVEALKKVKAELKRYRQAVLKAAFEGKLTADWRKKNKDKLEPASKLLERIAKEREKSSKGKAKPLPPMDTSNLPELSDGWEWTTVEHLNPPNRSCSYGVLKPGQDVDGGIPLIRVGDINNGRVEIQQIKHITPQIAERYKRTKLQGGEVLITLVGAIGRTAVVPQTLIGANTARAVGVIPLHSDVNPAWVELWFRNPDKILEMTAKSHEVARKTLNLEDVRTAFVGFPPVAEQKVIVEEIDRHFSIGDEVEQTIEKSLKEANRLRQSILKKAFEGKLVPQDPSDEPAEKLLGRIKAEKAKLQSKQKTKGDKYEHTKT